MVISSLNKLQRGIAETGGVILLAWSAIKQALLPPYRWQQIFGQLKFIGVQSLFIVVLTGIFTGMVFALQSGRAFRLFNAETLTGAVAGLSITRELGPVLTAIMITARAGSAMAAELGTMRVTQQIDALVAMAVNPVNYLVVPRVIATVIMAPLLTAIFNFVGAVGSYIVGIHLLKIEEAIFMKNLKFFVNPDDLMQSFFKAAVFGLILSVVGCYKGLNVHGGAKGVGEATTQAVVISCVAILVGDYFLTAIFF